MPDVCISCSFLLSQYIESGTISRKIATLANRQNEREYRIPCSQKCPNFSREIQVQTQ